MTRSAGCQADIYPSENLISDSLPCTIFVHDHDNYDSVVYYNQDNHNINKLYISTSPPPP